MMKSIRVHREGQTITIWSDDKDLIDRIIDAINVILDAECWRDRIGNEKRERL